MNISKLLVKYYQNNEWSCGNTYESLKWKDKTTPKPTKEHIESLWNEFYKDKMREERNKLLKESDFMMLSDYPHTNKEAWVLYRQQLRDFPATWTEGTPFPTPPE
jgi:hypothetical protein